MGKRLAVHRDTQPRTSGTSAAGPRNSVSVRFVDRPASLSWNGRCFPKHLAWLTKAVLEVLVSWFRTLRHRLRRHEYRLRKVGDVVLLFSALFICLLIAAALLRTRS
jgi:hypothetical protein